MKIRSVVHGGHDAREMVAGGITAIVCVGVGPRIAWFGRETNLLYWDDTSRAGRGAWRIRGGHRLWLTRPDADETEETYEPDNAACEVRVLRDGLRVVAPPTLARIQKSLTLRARDGAWTVSHRIQNVGDMLWSGGIWALTCTRPLASTRYRIPLDGGSPAWDMLTLIVPRRWAGHTSLVADPQLELREDALHVRARGREAKRMLFAPRGTLEMRDRRGAFSKTAARVPGARYPLGTNVACYLAPGAEMVELETMSPLVTLLPGETLDHVETWRIARIDRR